MQSLITFIRISDPIPEFKKYVLIIDRENITQRNPREVFQFYSHLRVKKTLNSIKMLVLLEKERNRKKHIYSVLIRIIITFVLLHIPVINLIVGSRNMIKFQKV